MQQFVAILIHRLFAFLFARLREPQVAGYSGAQAREDRSSQRMPEGKAINVKNEPGDMEKHHERAMVMYRLRKLGLPVPSFAGISMDEQDDYLKLLKYLERKWLESPEEQEDTRRVLKYLERRSLEFQKNMAKM